MKNDEIIALVRAHVRHQHETFRVRVMAIAANAEATSPKLAKTLRDLLGQDVRTLTPLPTNMAGMLSELDADVSLEDMVLEDAPRQHLQRVLGEYDARDKLTAHGLRPSRKLLLVGPPGVGKTMAASVLAHELKQRIWLVNLHAVIASHLGETAANLAKVFEFMHSVPGVYLFDEFDAIGADRGSHDGSSAGAEMRRVVNSLLSLIERDKSESLIIATTNYDEVIDRAMFRRFDEVIRFPAVNAAVAECLIKRSLLSMNGIDDWARLVEAAVGMGHADLVAAVQQCNKNAVLDGREIVLTGQLVTAVAARRRHCEPS